MTTSKKNMEQLTESFLNEGLTVREQADLKELLKVSENKDYFKKLYMIWHNTHHAGDEEYIEKALQKAFYQNEREQQCKQRGQSGLYISFLKIAAIVLIAFSLGAVFSRLVNSRKNTPASSIAVLASSRVIVPLGSKSQVELPDGTLVTLNAGSKLHYQTTFGQGTREVWLEGEGYFKVVKMLPSRLL